MDRETFRQKILDGEDQLISSRLWRFLNADQQRMILAAKAFWAANNDTTNTALDSYLAFYNQQQESNHESNSSYSDGFIADAFRQLVSSRTA